MDKKKFLAAIMIMDEVHDPFTTLEEWEVRKAGGDVASPPEEWASQIPAWFRLEPGFRFNYGAPSERCPAMVVGIGGCHQYELKSVSTPFGALMGMVPKPNLVDWVAVYRYKGSWSFLRLSELEPESWAAFEPFDLEGA